LEYSSGAAFRRALKHYTGATPTEVREGGGLRLVFRAFLSRTGLARIETRFRRPGAPEVRTSLRPPLRGTGSR
jgi:hypothetical protein